jgi:hypothetical protein
VGENLRYLIRDRHGRHVACALFGSAAWKCADRDVFLGWDRRIQAPVKDVYLYPLIPDFRRELCAPACSRTEGRAGR